MTEQQLRMTRQRRVILDRLQATMTHPSADEVFEMVREELPRISLGTVYRNLEIMSEMGLVKKIETAGSQRRYDARLDDHSHIRCVSCQRVADVDAPVSLEVEGDVERATGYKLLGHRLEFRGLCPDCRKVGKATKRN